MNRHKLLVSTPQYKPIAATCLVTPSVTAREIGAAKSFEKSLHNHLPLEPLEKPGIHAYINACRRVPREASHLRLHNHLPLEPLEKPGIHAYINTCRRVPREASRLRLHKHLP